MTARAMVPTNGSQEAENDAVLRRDGTISTPEYQLDELVAVLKTWCNDGPYVAQVVGLLVEDHGFWPIERCPTPSSTAIWAYMVRFADGAGDDIVTAHEILPLSEIADQE